MAEGFGNTNKVKLFSITEVLIIVLLASVPLFMSFPYRVNIFLSWEGAYRISQGQIPFKDFGLPMGYMYWVIPAIFFKLFGPQMITLIKAQFVINIISGLAFRSVLKSFSFPPEARLLCVLLYCVSFSFFNFWPWYNHTVIVYEMIALAFLLKYLFSAKKKWMFIALSALFNFFSFFTKQDAGAMACLLCIAILVCYCIYERNWDVLFIFLLSTAVIAFVMIAPLMRFSFGYWFNHGQPPHTSRISLFEIVDEFLYSSQWIKFYLFLIVIILFARYRTFKHFLNDKTNVIFLVLTIGILVEASILQVTSYTPPDNNIFFHSFAFAFILFNLTTFFNLKFYSLKPLALISLLMLLWWSGVFWKYIQRLSAKMLAKTEVKQTTGENIVNRKTYILTSPVGEIPMTQWGFSQLKSFKRVYMPKATIDGINRLLKMPGIKNNPSIRVLNMTELTPLAVEMPFKPETGSQIPLWYHLGVAMFNKQAENYEQKILNREYDLVMFEYIPTLNNFYPFRVRDTLLNHYQKVDSFPAPRAGNTQGIVEIFFKPIR